MPASYLAAVRTVTLATALLLGAVGIPIAAPSPVHATPKKATKKATKKAKRHEKRGKQA